MTTLIKRGIEKDILESLIPGRVTVLYGARRVGKTTMLDSIKSQLSGTILYLNADKSTDKAKLDTTDYLHLERVCQGLDYLLVDEAQQIENIGQILKILVDSFDRLKILVSGSASFDLANKVGEPLVGRKKTFILYPFSVGELNISEAEVMEYLLRFGMYPKVHQLVLEQDKSEYLTEIASDYLYKDILMLDGVKNAKKIKDLLIMLALQIGSEVSLSELGRGLGLHTDTVSRYLDLLEKSFVIINLRGFSRNLRKEVNKSSKYFFYDVGIRNSLINNFNYLKLRNDAGALWENFMILERMKWLQAHKLQANHYFWRTYQQKEIDLIQERDGKLLGVEFKLHRQGVKPPKEFLETYENSEFMEVGLENWQEFLPK